jgi:hypothetical protein
MAAWLRYDGMPMAVVEYFETDIKGNNR